MFVTCVADCDEARKCVPLTECDSAMTLKEQVHSTSDLFKKLELLQSLTGLFCGDKSTEMVCCNKQSDAGKNNSYEISGIDISKLKYCKGTIYITISTITSVCLSIRPSSGVRASQNFFSLKSPWNHPLTPGVDPRG